MKTENNGLQLLIGIAMAAGCTGALAQKMLCYGNSAIDEMVRVGPLCVDKFEASVWSSPGGTGTQYPQGDPRFPTWFPRNGNWTKPLYAASVRGTSPATFVTWFQAQQACALAGKRLLTNAEWQMAAAGTPDPGAVGDGFNSCNTTTGGLVRTGQAASCVSNWGVHDMIGNVQEWVADWIQGPGTNASTITGQFTPLAQIVSTPDYGSDWLNGINEAYRLAAPQSSEPIDERPDAMPAGITRGGIWTSGTAAGMFALDATHTPSSLDNATGFRCGR